MALAGMIILRGPPASFLTPRLRRFLRMERSWLAAPPQRLHTGAAMHLTSRCSRWEGRPTFAH